MATKNFLFTPVARSLAFALLILSLVSCQTASKKSGAPTAADSASGEVQPQPQAQIQVPPPPSPSEPKKVAVILGPGGAKAFAHIGVLKALQQQRIPISKVVGLEWGALVGGLFAAKGQLHDVEWKLYKMEQANLPFPKGFFAKKMGEETVKVMDSYLQDAFALETLGKSKISFACPSRSVWTGVVAWQDRGSYKEAIRRCLGFPPVFKIQGTFLAGASQATDAIARLRSEGYNVIIMVNVLGSAMPVKADSLPENLNLVVLWQEVKRAILDSEKLGVEVIDVDTSNFAMVQFDEKKNLISLGEAAGQKAAPALVSKYGF